MSLHDPQRLCLVPRSWSLAQARKFTCDGRHHHVSRRVANVLVHNGEAIWLNQKVLRRTRLGSKQKERQRDISAKMGEYFNWKYRHHESWAIAMLAAIRKQWERSKKKPQV